MKKLRLFPIILLVMVLLCSCSEGKTENAKIDCEKSQLYSQSDMDLAIGKIFSEFKEEFEDCTMDLITYAGDELARDELDYCNSLADEKIYDECIVSYSDFHTSYFSENPVLAAGQNYTDYKWYLARTKGGKWDLLTWGY